MSEKNKPSMDFFERYLSVWVLLGMAAGVLLGMAAKDSITVLSEFSYFGVNLPVAVLIWLMIFPMMVQIDFSSVGQAGHYLRGLGLTLSINWLIKPFSMALIAWLFFKFIFSSWLSPAEASEYIAGAILLGAAPCTAMVFVWSYLTRGDANYTLVQVSVNDLVLLVAFIPIVQLLLGITGITIPWSTLAASVVTFVVIPLAAGLLAHFALRKLKGDDWFKGVFLPALKPVSITALLTTLVLLFAFQSESLRSSPFKVLLIAIPLTLQTYAIFFIAWFGGRKLGLPHNICAPSSMIGASNFFELAVAVAIMLFGLNSGAALATVVGVLIEVPVMLSLVKLANRWRYETE